MLEAAEWGAAEWEALAADVDMVDAAEAAAAEAVAAAEAAVDAAVDAADSSSSSSTATCTADDPSFFDQDG